jgi:hypothetical protein
VPRDQLSIGFRSGTEWAASTANSPAASSSDGAQRSERHSPPALGGGRLSVESATLVQAGLDFGGAGCEEERPSWSGRAMRVFAQQEKGLLRLFRAADIYTIHVMAELSGTPPDEAQIAAIMSGRGLSGYAMLGMTYTPEQQLALEEKGDLREVGLLSGQAG